MPTFGWIQEDAWDRYLTALPHVEPAPPGPSRVRCPFCHADFEGLDGMLGHLADRHRGERPLLLLRASEPSAEGRFRVSTALRASDVHVQNCTAVRLSVDGAPARSIAVEEIPLHLASERDALLNIELENRFDPIAQPIVASYHLSIQVPEKRALDAVDRAFQRRFAVSMFHMGTVAAFLGDPACEGVARPYAAALADYVRGVLLKDQPVHAGITTPLARYRDLYGAALDGLRPHRRPLPDLVCSIVRFAMNNFEDDTPTGFDLLDGASRTLAALAGARQAGISARPEEKGQVLDVCPLDDGVSRVLDLWRRLRARPAWSPALRDECRAIAYASAFDAFDIEKALALWAEATLRASPDEAAEPLSLLSATYPFGTWASAERERMTNGQGL